MPSDDARRPSQPAPIKTPDQLQQAKAPDKGRPSAGSSPDGNGRAKPGEVPSRQAGILGQLETERAHD